MHLLHAELHEELAGLGFTVKPGGLGENVLTRGVDLLGLPVGSLLRFQRGPLVALTGLRNPCWQIDEYRTGLLAAVAFRDSDDTLVRKAGVMSVVLAGGEVRAGDEVAVALPPRPHLPLDRV